MKKFNVYYDGKFVGSYDSKLKAMGIDYLFPDPNKFEIRYEEAINQHPWKD